MLIHNIVNIEKKGKIDSFIFHVFFTTEFGTIFDENMDVPIIYGNKNVIKNTLKKFQTIINNPNRPIKVFYYRPYPLEFKMKLKYEGLPDQIVIPTF